MAIDIFDRLEQDHQEMREMMSQLSKQFDTQLFERLAKELESHSSAEEKVVYKAVVNEPQTHEIVLEGYEEHHVADLIVRELKSNEAGTDRWMAKLKVLRENVEHHLEEEEGEMFDKARTVISPEQAQEMASQFEAAKKNLNR